jgi:hypothetical protein
MSTRCRRLRLVVIALLVIVAVSLVVRNVLDHFRLATCKGLKLQVIGLALSNYHNVFGCLPPAYTLGADRKPMHSWRVLLLPYLGEQELYSQYDMTEPWNGPHNRLLAERMPAVFRCPAAASRQRPECTNYVAVVGQGTAWPGDGSVSFRQISKIPWRILIVEVADSEINWMEPADLTVAEAVAGVNKDLHRGISSHHPGGACCCMVVGGSCLLPNDTSAEVLKALVTIGGGARIIESESGGFILRPP